MRVLVFELNPKGHRLHYAGVVIQAVLDLAEEVVFVTSDGAIQTTAFEEYVQPYQKQIKVDSSCGEVQGSPLMQAIRTVNVFRKAVREHRPDHIFVPTASGFAQIFGLSERLGFRLIKKEIELEILLMRGHRFFSQSDWKTKMARWFWTRLLQSTGARVIHVLDPELHAQLSSSINGRLSDRLRHIPEPVEPLNISDQKQARQQLSLDTDGRYIGFFGKASLRKGADRLIRSFVSSHLRSNDRLLIMGGIDPPIRKLLEEHHEFVKDGRIVVIDRFVSQTELELGLASVNVICIPYPKHSGSSGFVVRAAAMHRWILATDHGWIGEMVQRFRLGQTCNVDRTEDMSIAIAKALEISDHSDVNDQQLLFTRYHSLENSKAHWSKRIRERLNASTSFKLIEWGSIDSRITKNKPCLSIGEVFTNGKNE